MGQVRKAITAGMIVVASLPPLVLTGCSSEPTTANDQASRPETSETKASGPFGLDLSMPLAKLEYDKVASDPAQGIYMLKTVPKPSSDFKHYGVVAYPDAGICGVIATSAEYEGDSLGSSVRAAVDGLAEALATKYGKPQKTDHCGGGEPFCNSEFWSMAVKDGDRTYSYDWSSVKNVSGIRDIHLGIDTDKVANPIVGLAYRVNDEAKCDRASKGNAAKNL